MDLFLLLRCGPVIPPVAALVRRIVRRDLPPEFGICRNGADIFLKSEAIRALGFSRMRDTWMAMIQTREPIMAFQFVHIETYAEQPKAVKGAPDQFNSAEQVLGEAAREKSLFTACREPARSNTSEFSRLDHSGRAAEKRSVLLAGIRETVTSANGRTYQRRLRADAATLYTEIHSHPMTPQDMTADPKNKREIANWAARIAMDFTARMPDGIDWTAVLHPDESHVHIHILAINTPDQSLTPTSCMSANAPPPGGAFATTAMSSPRCQNRN